MSTVRLVNYLRRLAATLHNAVVDEAADTIESLEAQLFVADEKIAAYEAPDAAPASTVTEYRDGKRVTFQKVAGHHGRPFVSGSRPPSS